jgi:hypothetical protein
MMNKTLADSLFCLEDALKQNKITQKTYERALVAKWHLEKKYKMKMREKEEFAKGNINYSQIWNWLRGN